MLIMSRLESQTNLNLGGAKLALINLMTSQNRIKKPLKWGGDILFNKNTVFTGDWT